MNKNRTVLIIDDDKRNILTLSAVLRAKGFKVESALDGIAGIEVLKSNPDIDLVLMDMMMPEMDGYETMKAMRKQKKWEKTPIIAVTAKAMLDDRKKCIQAGASDYISKPIDSDQLISLLQDWLHNK